MQEDLVRVHGGAAQGDAVHNLLMAVRPERRLAVLRHDAHVCGHRAVAVLVRAIVGLRARPPLPLGARHAYEKCPSGLPQPGWPTARRGLAQVGKALVQRGAGGRVGVVAQHLGVGLAQAPDRRNERVRLHRELLARREVVHRLLRARARRSARRRMRGAHPAGTAARSHRSQQSPSSAGARRGRERAAPGGCSAQWSAGAGRGARAGRGRARRAGRCAGRPCPGARWCRPG